MSGSCRAYEGNEPFVFISYSHRDNGKVLPVILSLYDLKYRVWYDEGIAPGSEWPQNIARHLQKASAFIAFVSQNYLDSPNCENEARLAAGQKMRILQISLDGVSRHPMMEHAETLYFDDGDDDLVSRLTGSGGLGLEFIGDGISGYQYSIEKKRSFNVWNLLLGLAVVLTLVFATTLYGLYRGWFDSLLPARQPAIETVSPTPPPQETLSIGENIIGSVLPVKFSSEEEKRAVYQKLGWDQPYEMTYKDLVGMVKLTRLEISNEPITDIAFAAYLPNLEEILLTDSPVRDLSPLIECPKLKTVRVTVDMLPMTLPTPRSFEVEVN